MLRKTNERKLKWNKSHSLQRLESLSVISKILLKISLQNSAFKPGNLSNVPQNEGYSADYISKRFQQKVSHSESARILVIGLVSMK